MLWNSHNKINFLHYINVTAVKSTIVPVQSNIFRRQHNPRRGCSLKISGTSFVCNEPGRSILVLEFNIELDFGPQSLKVLNIWYRAGMIIEVKVILTNDLLGRRQNGDVNCIPQDLIDLTPTDAVVVFVMNCLNNNYNYWNAGHDSPYSDWCSDSLCYELFKRQL